VADLSRDELHRLARLGAEARLRELRQEEDSIRQAFPDLFGAGPARRGRRPRAAASPAAAPAPAAANSASRKGRRYTMSAAQKRAVSERMKKYWAGRRREKARAAK
jgi:hypothetical protein